MSTSTTRICRPSDLAVASVSPAEATSGSVKTTCGAPRWSAQAAMPGPSVGAPAARAAMTSPATRPWYLPMWVSRLRPLTSPTA